MLFPRLDDSPMFRQQVFIVIIIIFSVFIRYLYVSEDPDRGIM